MTFCGFWEELGLAYFIVEKRVQATIIWEHRSVCGRLPDNPRELSYP